MLVAPIPLQCPEHGLRAVHVVQAEHVLAEVRCRRLPSGMTQEDVNELRDATTAERRDVERCPSCRVVHLRVAMSPPEVAEFLRDDSDVVVDLDDGDVVVDLDP